MEYIKYKISIIVPVHNASNTLDICVESILKQNYSDIECILVENGSSDNSKEICLKYSSNHKNIISVFCKEAGVSNARNKGLEMATGDYIGFCDTDDYLEPGAIERVVSEFKNDSSINAVFTAFYCEKWEDKRRTRTYVCLNKSKLSIKKAIQHTIINDSVMGSVWNKYYKRELLRNRLFDSKLEYCEDMHFNVQVLSLAPQNGYIKILNIPTYNYVMREDSATHNIDNLFDKYGEFKYTTTLTAIMRECKLDNRTLSLVKMKIASLAVDTLTSPKLDGAKSVVLLQHLKDNYIHLVRNLFKGNLKRNIKRLIKGGKFLLDNVK